MKTENFLQDLDKLLANSELPVLIYFYTNYCGNSRLMNSILEQVSNQMQEQLKIIKVDSEVYTNLADRYKIHALPTLLLFKNNQLVTRIESEATENILSAERLIERLKRLI